MAPYNAPFTDPVNKREYNKMYFNRIEFLDSPPEHEHYLQIGINKYIVSYRNSRFKSQLDVFDGLEENVQDSFEQKPREEMPAWKEFIMMEYAKLVVENMKERFSDYMRHKQANSDYGNSRGEGGSYSSQDGTAHTGMKADYKPEPDFQRDLVSRLMSLPGFQN